MPQSGMFLLADISKTGLSSNAFVKQLLEEENWLSCQAHHLEKMPTI